MKDVLDAEVLKKAEEAAAKAAQAASPQDENISLYQRLKESTITSNNLRTDNNIWFNHLVSTFINPKVQIPIDDESILSKRLYNIYALSKSPMTSYMKNKMNNNKSLFKIKNIEYTEFEFNLSD